MPYPKINDKWLDTHEWMVRGSKNGVSNNGGFCWKRKRAWTVAPNWVDPPNTRCGRGLHGNAVEAGGFGVGDDPTRLELAETRGPRVVVTVGSRNKIKVREARLVAYDDEIPPRAFVLSNCADDALAEASWGGHVVLVRGLLRAGANVHTYSDAPLRWAAQAGHTAVVRALLRAGAGGWNAALSAARNGDRTAVVRVLKAHIAKHG